MTMTQDFVAYFAVLTGDLEFNYHVVYRGVVQQPEKWRQLAALATKEPLRLVIRSRM